jgi:hypothetical protein
MASLEADCLPRVRRGKREQRVKISLPSLAALAALFVKFYRDTFSSVGISSTPNSTASQREFLFVYSRQLEVYSTDSDGSALLQNFIQAIINTFRLLFSIGTE